MALKIIASTPDLCFAVQYVPVGISVDRNETFISYADDKFHRYISGWCYRVQNIQASLVPFKVLLYLGDTGLKV